MQIQLKQAEIVEALQQYITHKGINLTGKDVKITFTAGRKESGLTAELTIDDVLIPGYGDVTDDSEETKAATLTVVASNPAEPEEDPPAEDPNTPTPPTPTLFS